MENLYSLRRYLSSLPYGVSVKIRGVINVLRNRHTTQFPTPINTLPNPGGVPVFKAREAIKDMNNAGEMSGRLKGVDIRDSVRYYTGLGLHESFAPLAVALRRICKQELIFPLSVLELGTGWGSLFHWINHFCLINYVCIDAQPLILEKSPFIEEYKKNFLIQDLQEKIRLTNLNGKPMSFNLIISFECLEHLKKNSISNVIWTIKNHLSSNGLFIGSTAKHKLDSHLTIEPREWGMDKFKQEGVIECKKLKSTGNSRNI